MIGGTTAIPEIWVVDATPIIIMAKIGHLELLTSDTRVALLPSPVVREIRKGSASDPARVAVEAGWGTRITVSYIPVGVRALGLLGIGEQSVLTLALKRPGSRVVLDDEQARKGAKKLGLPLIGTLGVVLLAKRQGRISAVAPLFLAVRGAGCYADDDLLRQLAMSVGEPWP